MTALLELWDAIGDQLAAELDGAIDGLQIVPRYVYAPTTPCLDVYLGDPAISQEGFDSWAAVFTIRARVSQSDANAGQELLAELLDPSSPLSVRAALRADPTFGGKADSSGLEEGAADATGFQTYRYGEQELLGCEWRLRAVLS